MTRAGIMAMMRPPATGGPPPVTLFEDDFESYADGSALDAAPLWTTANGTQDFNSGGAGAMTIDTHTAHKPGQVVDMSTVGCQYAIWQGGQVGSDDHYVQIAAFPDIGNTDGGAAYYGYGGGAGVLLRMQAASPTSPSGYCAVFFRYRTGASTHETLVELWRIDSEVWTLLDTTSDLSGTVDAEEVHTLRADIDGATITVDLDGSQQISYDTTSDGTKYTTGQHVGVYLVRDVATVAIQPFFDDFEAGTL